jgi:hypothetical protein
MPPLRDSLHLREAAIHEQFGSRNVAAVIGWEKHHGLGNLRDGSRLGRWGLSAYMLLLRRICTPVKNARSTAQREASGVRTIPGLHAPRREPYT